MKVLIASHGIFPESLGGMERHTLNLAQSLYVLGIRVTVCVPECSHSLSYPFEVKRMPWPKHLPWLLGNWYFSQAVAKALAVEAFDLAWSQGFALWAYLAKKQVPLWYHPHGLEMFGDLLSPSEWVKTIPFRVLAKYHARRADKTISLGGKLTSIIEQKLHVPPSRILSIPNAVGDREVAQLEKVPNSFLFVGRLAFNKGLDLLVEALKHTKALDFTLTLVGSGPMATKIQNLGRMDARVKYLPYVSEEELLALYDRHECLLFCSRFEGMPTVILEAMRSNCAIIATNIGAVSTMVGPSNGVLINPNAEALAEAIAYYLGLSVRQRHDMGQASRAIVAEHYGWPKIAKAIVAML